MAEIALSIASKISEYLVEPVMRQLRLIFCFRSIVDEFKKEYEKLSMRQDRVKNSVREARNNAQVIEKDVEKWLEDVKATMEDVQKLILQNDHLKEVMKDVQQQLSEAESEATKSCYSTRWSTKWTYCQYGLSREISEKTITMKSLFEGSEFDRVAHPAALQDLELSFSDDQFVPFESATTAFNQIMMELKKSEVNKVALYGMGGSGKTTLAKQVGKKAQELKMFTHVVMVVISENPDVRRIQGTIADFLNLKLEQESEEGRASKLHARLKDEKILIILDDVWKNIDLRAIGIGSDCKGCKILLTTRRLDVCRLMNTQQNIHLGMPSEDEAWDFFRRKAGLTSDNGSEMNNVAKKVARECNGLPIALETIGATLRNRSADEWKEAHEKLRNAKLVDIAGINDVKEKNAYRCLKLSYDYLKQSAEAQTQFLLLLCSLFPEDHEIDIEDLARYAFGLQLFQNVSSVEDARRKVRVTVRLLKDSCLLLGTDKEHCVKMHDMVRDVALWIGSSEAPERNVVTVRNGTDLKDLLGRKGFESCRAISFMPGSLTELQLPNYELKCSELEILLLFGGPGGNENILLPDAFCKDMIVLKVLDMRPYARQSFFLPQSLRFLTNLRTLNLRSFYSVDISILEELKTLEILSIEGCFLSCGMDAIGAMHQLRLLDLSHSKFPRMLHSNIIRKFSRLEEFYILGGYFDESEVVRRSGIAEKTILLELKSLPKLVILSIEVKNARSLPDNFSFPQHLERYDISAGRKIGNVVVNKYPTRRALYLANIGAWPLSAFKKLLPRTQHLDLVNIGRQREGFKNIIPYVDEGGLKELICLKIDDGEISCLVDTRLCPIPTTAFPELVELYLANMDSITSLCQGPIPGGFLQKLQKLSLSECRGLAAIFPAELFRRVIKLEEMEVVRCDEVETVFQMGEDKNHLLLQPFGYSLKILKLERLAKLMHIWKGPTRQQLVRLANLTEVIISDCWKLKCIFSPSLALCLQHLRILEISRCGDLVEIISTEVPDHQLVVGFENLRVLKVHHCDKLKRMFPISMASSGALMQLEDVRISDNAELEYLFVGNGTEADRALLLQLPRLKRLVLSELPKFISFLYPVDGDYFSQWPYLVELVVWNCPRTSQQFGAHLKTQMKARAKKLVIIELSNIQGVEEIMQLQRENELLIYDLDYLVLRDLRDVKCIWKGPTENVCFSNLKYMTVSACNRLTLLFTTTIARSLRQLKELHIEGCNELEHVIIEEGGDDILLAQHQHRNIVFPELSLLTLKDLPRLISFCPTTYHLMLPLLQSIWGLKVEGCPRLMVPEFSS